VQLVRHVRHLVGHQVPLVRVARELSGSHRETPPRPTRLVSASAQHLSPLAGRPARYGDLPRYIPATAASATPSDRRISSISSGHVGGEQYSPVAGPFPEVLLYSRSTLPAGEPDLTLKFTRWTYPPTQWLPSGWPGRQQR
jgi:hypothetical protein